MGENQLKRGTTSWNGKKMITIIKYVDKTQNVAGSGITNITVKLSES